MIRGLPLRILIPLVVALFALLFNGASYLSTRHLVHEEINQATLLEVRNRLNLIQGSIQRFLRLDHVDGIRQIVSSFGTELDLVVIFITDGEGIIQSSTRQEDETRAWQETPFPLDKATVAKVLDTQVAQTKISHDQHWIQGYYSICGAGSARSLRPKQCGFLYYQSDLSYHRQMTDDSLLEQALLTGTGIAIAVMALIMLFHLRITRRITRLVTVLEAFANGNRAIRADVQGADELTRIGTGVNRVLDHLQQEESALRKSASQLAQAQRIAHIGNWEWDISHNRIEWSQEVNRLFGLEEPSSHDYDTYFSRVHVEDVPAVERAMEAALLSGEGFDFEHRITRPDGMIRVVQEIGEITRNTDGEAIFLTGTVQDITERKKADRLKNEFVSTVSHELRTPLTSIYGGLKMVLAGVTGELPQKAHKLLTLAYNNSERLNLLINDILDIQKIESGRISLQFQPLDAAALARRALAENAGYGEKFGVRYHFLEPIPEGIMVRGDEHRLCQVLANFLSNAAKFSQSGDAVEVRVEPEGDSVLFSVTDHGSGIPEEFQPRVFQKFAQADSSDTRQKGGTGLGLSITKALVESHHGQIGFATRADEGTTFFFRLPRLRLDPEA
ncbi:MAG: PAS domain-containing protein [Magnetococcales bacterium]|nr:PAS domain-containing protein [Magnetococcales bacterium]